MTHATRVGVQIMILKLLLITQDINLRKKNNIATLNKSDTKSHGLTVLVGYTAASIAKNASCIPTIFGAVVPQARSVS